MASWHPKRTVGWPRDMATRPAWGPGHVANPK